MAIFLAMPVAARANLVWPSLLIVDKYCTWYVILAALIVELLAIKYFTKSTWGKAAIMDLSINAISALLGLLLIPLVGVLVEILLLPFGGGTFDLSHWIFAYIAAVFTNTIVEGSALKFIFKLPFKGTFWWLFAANAISVIISIFVEPTWI